MVGEHRPDDLGDLVDDLLRRLLGYVFSDRLPKTLGQPRTIGGEGLLEANELLERFPGCASRAIVQRCTYALCLPP